MSSLFGILISLSRYHVIRKSKNAVSISLEPIRGYSKAKYLCKTRVDYLRWLLLSLACMEGMEQSPGIAAVLYTIKDAQMLNCVNQLFIEHDVLSRSLIKYDEIFDDISYEDFVGWKLLTVARSSALHIANKDKKKAKPYQFDNLRCIDKQSLFYMCDRGCADFPSKSFLKTKITELLPEAESDRLCTRRVALLVCRYVYILRCDGVHANREYPVFNSNAMLKKRLLGDFLETVIVGFAIWLAMNY